MFASFRASKEKVVALFDIGSGSVGGSIVLARERGKPVVLASCRKDFPLRESASGGRMVSDMLASLKDAARHLQKEHRGVPQKIHVMLSAPWSVTSLRTIRRQRKDGFLFTERYGRELVDGEIEVLGRDEPLFDHLIERRVIDVRLNGYEVRRPHGKRAKSVEVRALLSMSSSSLLKSVRDAIGTTYRQPVSFTSQLFADFIVVRDFFSSRNDFIIFDIDEEFTEISAMGRDVLLGTASVPYGRRTLIRGIAARLGLSSREAMALLSAGGGGHLDAIIEAPVRQAVLGEARIWIDGVKTAFRQLFADALIPHDIFLIADSKAAPWFQDILTKDNFPEFTTTKDGFDVILANSRILDDLCVSSLGSKKEANMAMQAVFINSIIFS